MYALSEKGERIRAMFGSIAPRYDLLNRLLSLGIDRRWRRFAVGKIGLRGPGLVLDVATGTGDVALEIASQTPVSVNIVGIDFTPEMIDLGRVKVQESRHAGRIKLEGLTLVVTKIYFDAIGRLKAELGLAKGKKLHDKRATSRDQDAKREIARAMRRRG